LGHAGRRSRPRVGFEGRGARRLACASSSRRPGNGGRPCSPTTPAKVTLDLVAPDSITAWKLAVVATSPGGPAARPGSGSAKERSRSSRTSSLSLRCLTR
jgi:hypothetical protein